MKARLPQRVAEVSISLLVWLFDFVREMACRVLRIRRKARFIVLYYHGISDAEKGGFERQMELVKRVANPVAIDSARYSEKKYNVAVSFDDGLKSSFENGCRVAVRLGIPVAVFIVAGKLGKQADWFVGAAYRSRQESVIDHQELSVWKNEPLLTIGSHGLSHRPCTSLDDAELYRELRMSAEILGGIVGKSVIYYSYPHGHSDKRVESALSHTGYRLGYTIAPRCISADTHPLRLGRFSANPDDWDIEFLLKIKGAYRWLPFVRRIKNCCTRSIRDAIPLQRRHGDYSFQKHES